MQSSMWSWSRLPERTSSPGGRSNMQNKSSLMLAVTSRSGSLQSCLPYREHIWALQTTDLSQKSPTTHCLRSANTHLVVHFKPIGIISPPVPVLTRPEPCTCGIAQKWSHPRPWFPDCRSAKADSSSHMMIPWSGTGSPRRK